MEKNCQVVFVHGDSKMDWMPSDDMNESQLISNLTIAMELAQERINKEKNKVTIKSLSHRIKNICFQIFKKHSQQQQQQQQLQQQKQQNKQIKISDDDLQKSKITIYKEEAKTLVVFDLNTPNEETVNHRWFKKTVRSFCLECRINNACFT